MANKWQLNCKIPANIVLFMSQYSHSLTDMFSYFLSPIGHYWVSWVAKPFQSSLTLLSDLWRLNGEGLAGHRDI